MDIDYSRITDFILTSGKRIVTKAGKIKDIGITKKDLTEEDLAIERGFKEIIQSFGPEHVLFAEEEHAVFAESNQLWIVDPISGTSSFLKGEPHYGIVVSHVVHHETVFAAVYDPSVDELFTAYKGKGAFLNDKPIYVNEHAPCLFRVSQVYPANVMERLGSILSPLYEVKTEVGSLAVSYCQVARGKYSGVVSMTKDSFPEYAGAFIVKEAGGVFTNIKGEENFSPTDRFFIGGDFKTQASLINILQNFTV
jgi:myo-inositol-1(or 4)-monophosphatase